MQQKYKKQNLVIKNLPEDATKEDLKEFFEKFGPVKNTKVFTKPVFPYIGQKGPNNFKCTGVGFVCF